MIDHMLSYKPANDTDEARFTARIRRAIESLEEVRIIRPIPGTERFLVYGVITSLLSAERVAALDARYRAIASGAPVGGNPPESSGDDAPEDDHGPAEARAAQAEEEDTDD